jgi:hypothetical protein
MESVRIVLGLRERRPRKNSVKDWSVIRALCSNWLLPLQQSHKATQQLSVGVGIVESEPSEFLDLDGLSMKETGRRRRY